MTETLLKPIGDRIVVVPDAREEVLKSGLILPDTSQEKPQTGTVVAVGDGKFNVRGERETLGLVEGDRVLFSKFGGTEIEHQGSDRVVLRETDILCKIEDENE